MTMHVIRFSGNERLSERLSWRLFGRLRRKRIGCLKAVCEVRKRGFVTRCLAQRTIIRAQSTKFALVNCLCSLLRITQYVFCACSSQLYFISRAVTSFPIEGMADSDSITSVSLSVSDFLCFEI